MTRFFAAVVTALFALPLFSAEPSLPPYFPLPAGAQISNVEAAEYSEAEFIVPNSDDKVVQRGKYWRADVALPSLDPDMEQPQIWARMKPVLLRAGWTPLFEGNTNPLSATMRYQKDGKNAWADIDVTNPATIGVSIIEVGQMKASFALNAPAAKPESVSAESGDFPYLAPLPGSTRSSSAYDSGPMMVQIPGQEQPEIVAEGSIVKEYNAPDGLSNLAFATLYGQALTRAGWTLTQNAQSMHQTDVLLQAHYTRNDRNLWTELHYGGGSYTVKVADVGAQQLAAEIAKKCHVPLYGVLFDFDKARLRADSTPVLDKVRELLASDPSLKLVIEGHTDNVGTAGHNQRLSEARAASVVSWLVAHGIAANRLSSAGYGASRPIAGNDDDAGRAKNRRVELRKQGCNG